MHARVSKWGNSLAVRLPKLAADSLGLGEGSNVELSLEGDRLVISCGKPVYRLDDLLAGITPENQPESFDDQAHGKELI